MIYAQIRTSFLLNPFIQFCLQHKPLLITSVIIIFIQFGIFKFLYPDPGFIGGSLLYIEAAYGNYNIATYPIGYSKFLRLFSVFTHSNFLLVLFQYLYLHTSTLLLTFSLGYIYKPAKVFLLILVGAFVLNPVFLYLSNYITSDSLFIALSLNWFTTLVWILHAPRKALILLHAFLLLFAFTVRYNALIYPIIALPSFFFSPLPNRQKWLGYAFSLLLIGGFVFHTQGQYKRLMGIRTFSPFSGWQMANNALFVYRYVQKEPHPPMPEKFRKLDTIVRTYFDTSQNLMTHPWEMLVASSFYMWDPRSPLNIYMFNQGSGKNSYLKNWSQVGPLYNEYGKYIILQYPKAFIQFHALPNFFKFYAPPVEFLGQYNMGYDTIAPLEKMWFDMNRTKVSNYFHNQEVNALNFYPILTGIVNILLFMGLIGFLILSGHKRYLIFSKGLALVMVFWIVNLGFSVFASPIALRFQLVPIFVFTAFVVLLVDWIWRMARSG